MDENKDDNFLKPIGQAEEAEPDRSGEVLHEEDSLKPSTEYGPYPNLFPTEIDEEKQRKERAAGFTRLALPCLIYAVVFVFCIYDNTMAVTMPVWTAALAGLVVYFIRKTGRELKKGSTFIITVMILIGISTFLTGNYIIVFMNYAAEMLLLVSLMIHNYADDFGWDFGKYFGSIIVAVFSAVGRTFSPFADCAAYMKEHSGNKNGKARPILIGIVIAVPSLVILGALLSSADMVFSSVIKRLFRAITVPDQFFGILFMLLFGFFSAYCGMRSIEESAGKMKYSNKRNGDPVTAITVTSLIAVMYLIFSVVQIMYLFLGGFALPDGISYAEYARKGFFELLCVCVINLCIVLVIKKYVKENKILNAVLIIISGCTYIMISSSACRMIMYIREYHLTFMRVFVLVALFTLAVLLAGVIVYIVREKFPFFQYGLAVVSVIYIVFAFSHADSFIARYNLSTSPGVGNYSYQRLPDNDDIEDYYVNVSTDFWYLSELSTDAAPVITEYLENAGIPRDKWRHLGWYSNYIYSVRSDIRDVGNIRKYNVSFSIAYKVLETNIE